MRRTSSPWWACTFLAEVPRASATASMTSKRSADVDTLTSASLIERFESEDSHLVGLGVVAHGGLGHAALAGVFAERHADGDRVVVAVLGQRLAGDVDGLAQPFVALSDLCPIDRAHDSSSENSPVTGIDDPGSIDPGCAVGASATPCNMIGHRGVPTVPTGALRGSQGHTAPSGPSYAESPVTIIEAGAVDADERDVPLVDWRTEARCLGLPVSWFFADPYDLIGDLALSICRSCPVREPCFEAALAEERVGWACHGIRGGATASSRRRLLKARVMSSAGHDVVGVETPSSGRSFVEQPVELARADRSARAPRTVHLHRPFAVML
jgi:Transcription factor WhiB